MHRQIILDTETTGLSPEEGHRIIEVGCLELINRRVTGNNFHRYINPMRTIDRGAEEVHGLTTEFLSDKPVFTDIVDEFLEFIKGAELIIHNAPFDIGFLNYEMQLISKKYKTIADYCVITDSLALARRKHPGQHNSLDALCRRYHVDNTNRELHGALLDAELLAQVFLLMTGGQTQLFQSESVEQSSRSQSNNSIKRIVIEKGTLTVVEAGEEELKAHQEFLENIKKSGVCVWLNQEITETV